ncbi:MAG: recombination protein RecR [Candidatus Pacebacteria bacterium]|nr:recombination protein RecR [Candidatus Paceibacterota bacterium]MBP9839452.1 recombination protein RecR [Candidatus Paceibacterota bacterium]
MDTIDKLTEIFKEFPGIGERQARRFVYFLMSRNGEYASNLTRLVAELKKEISQCNECYIFFISNNGKICDICKDPNTDSSLLMIVEKDSDLESVRKSRVYLGKYFILGGLVPIVEKTTKSRVRIEELKNRISKEGLNLKEIILAFSLSPQGDHTDFYVRSQLKEVIEINNIKISSLGRGLSTGTELEYSDNDTLKNALKNRQ